jgi:hypothetical protein
MVPELRHSSPGVIVSTLKKALGLQEVANKHAARTEFPPLEELWKKFDERHGPQQWSEPNQWELSPSKDTKSVF